MMLGVQSSKRTRDLQQIIQRTPARTPGSSGCEYMQPNASEPAKRSFLLMGKHFGLTLEALRHKRRNENQPTPTQPPHPTTISPHRARQAQATPCGPLPPTFQGPHHPSHQTLIVQYNKIVRVGQRVHTHSHCDHGLWVIYTPVYIQ